MRVSVILPSYNHAPYLKQRIDSILAQTFQDFELIILDDKSPDNSKEIIEQYRGHEKISHIVINKENTGNTFIQWDLGFSLAKGEYIWIAESDDFAEPQFLEHCVAALDSNRSAVMCFSDSNFVDSKGDKIKKFHLEKSHVLKYSRHQEAPVLYSGISFVRDHMLMDNLIFNASMVLFRRDVLPEIPDFYKTFRGCGDWVFWTDMMMCHDLVHVPKRLNNFRQHEQKVSNSSTQRRECYIEIPTLLLYLLARYNYYRKTMPERVDEPKTAATPTLMNAKNCLDKYIVDLSEDDKVDQKEPKRKIALYKIKTYLFGFIPIYKVKSYGKLNRHYLFGFIPLFSVKRY